MPKQEKTVGIKDISFENLESSARKNTNVYYLRSNDNVFKQILRTSKNVSCGPIKYSRKWVAEFKLLECRLESRSLEEDQV